MEINKLIEMLHQYIREELIAVSEINDNVIRVRFNDGSILNISVT